MDFTIFNFIYQFSGRWRFLDLTALFLAQWLMPLVALSLVGAILFLALKRKSIHLPLFALLAGAGGKIIEQIFEFLTFFPRPFVVLGFQPLTAVDPLESSFPSGHASFMFGVSIMLIYESYANLRIANKKILRILGISFFVVSLFVGIARVYVGVHWPLDIIGGAFAGLLSAGVAQLILLRDHPLRDDPSRGNS